MSELKIVQVLPDFGLRGTQKSGQLISIGLHERGREVEVWAFEGGPREDILKENGLQTKILNKGLFREKLENEEVDVVHFHGGFSEEEHKIARDNAEIVCETSNFGWFRSESLENLDYAFFPSKMSMLRFSKVNPRKFERYYNKFRLLYYPVQSADRSHNIRNELDIENDATLVGKIGGSGEGKWSSIAIEGFARYARENQNAKFALVNPPKSIKNKLKELNLENKVIEIKNIPPDKVGGFYEAIDVMAHSSALGESFGYVLAESLSHGVPIVVDSNPMRDNAQLELINNRKTGYIANTSEAFAKSIQKAESLSFDISDTILEDISYKRIAERLEKFYYFKSNPNGLRVEGNISEPDRADLEKFEEQYNERLIDFIPPEGRRHKYERICWNISTNFPYMNKKIYDILRGFFQYDRKLYKIVKLWHKLKGV